MWTRILLKIERIDYFLGEKLVIVKANNVIEHSLRYLLYPFVV